MDGPAKMRVQVMDRLAERDVIRRDHDVWFYNSKDNSAAHLTLPAVASDLPLQVPEGPGVQPGQNGSGQDGSVPDQRHGPSPRRKTWPRSSSPRLTAPRR